MRPGFYEFILAVGIIVLIFGVGRFTILKDSFVRSVKEFKHAVKGTDRD